MSEGLEYSLYRSTASRALRAGGLEDILAAARARNQAMSLTGCLHYEDGLFFQWLEGPADALREVLGSILRDDRHRDIAVLVEGALEHRRFQDWRMRFSDRDRASLLDWLASAEVSTMDRRDYAAAVMSFLQSVEA